VLSDGGGRGASPSPTLAARTPTVYSNVRKLADGASTILSATDRDSTTPQDAERLTFRYERLRAIAAGVIETAGGTFLLLIAVTHFNAGRTEKALVASGGNPGLLLTPLVIFAVSTLGWRTSLGAARILLLGAGGFMAAALFPVLPVFIAGSMLGLACTSACIPLLTQMYHDNYPAEKRGRLFSSTVMIRIVAAAGFSYAGGRLLSINMGSFQGLLLMFSVALMASSYCLWRCPSRPLAGGMRARPFSGLKYVKEDYLFRQTLISWMLMGTGNLMIYTLRVEYMANPAYGEAFSAADVALLTGVVPNIARLLLCPIWGRLFDRMNFFTMRIVLNFGLALGALTFFAGRDMSGMMLGAVIFGVSNAGGEVAWSLWVTKLARPERVAEYMSVHTFLTGLRGVLAPLLSYYLLAWISFNTLSFISAALIVLASLLLLPEIRALRAKPAVKLVEEVPE